MSDVVVELQAVVKTYGGQPVLDRVDLSVRRGEFLTLLGPSGCGKTTLLRLIAGFEAPCAGAVTIAGRDMAGFNADSPKALYLAEEVAAGMNWNGEAFLANQENPALHYLYPKEGAIIWMDSFVIPSGAAHVGAAHRFIDFVLRPEISKQISEEIGYATPNLAAVALLSEDLRNNRIVYPSDEDLRNAEFQTSVGEALSVYQRYWQRLKAGR